MANWQLPQDVMHVLLEGVVKQELQLLLQVFIYDKKLFTLSILNAQLESFGYGYSEVACKPSALQSNESSSFTFHQSGKIDIIRCTLVLFVSCHSQLTFVLDDIIYICSYYKHRAYINISV